MADARTRLQVYQEAADRGLENRLPPAQRAAYQEAVNRGLIAGVNVPTTVGQKAVGTLETLLTLGSGMVAEPVAGLAGLGTAIYNRITGDDFGLDEVTRNIESTRSALTIEPKTRGGQQVLGVVSAPFQKLNEIAVAGGEAVQDLGAPPSVAAATQVAIEQFPSLLGIRGAKGRRTRRQEARDRAQRIEEQTGVDPGAAPVRQAEQARDFVEAQTGGATRSAENFDVVRQAVADNQQLAKGVVDKLYNDARATSAGVRTQAVLDFVDVANDAAREFDPKTMPRLAARLDELEQIRELPLNSAVRIEALENWRRRLSRARAPESDVAQNAALTMLKGQYDNFMDNAFITNMITGDPRAVAKWRDARVENASYARIFKDNKTLRQIWEKQLDADEVKNLLFGATQVGFKRGARELVERIEGITGKDSAAMAAIRQDAVLDIISPLMSPEPNIKAFTRNYDRFVTKNKEMAQALFPDSLTALEDLRDVVQAATDVKSRQFKLDFVEATARALFGHEIQKASLRKSLAVQGIGLLLRVGGKSRRRRVMSEIMGYDVGAPVIGRAPTLITGAARAATEEAEELEQ